MSGCHQEPMGELVASEVFSVGIAAAKEAVATVGWVEPVALVAPMEAAMGGGQEVWMAAAAAMAVLTAVAATERVAVVRGKGAAEMGGCKEVEGRAVAEEVPMDGGVMEEGRRESVVEGGALAAMAVTMARVARVEAPPAKALREARVTVMAAAPAETAAQELVAPVMAYMVEVPMVVFVVGGKRGEAAKAVATQVVAWTVA